MLNDEYIFHIYVRLGHYIMQYYLSSAAREPNLFLHLVEWTSRAELSRARSASEPAHFQL
jgi:hypothetical protein